MITILAIIGSVILGILIGITLDFSEALFNKGDKVGYDRCMKEWHIEPILFTEEELKDDNSNQPLSDYDCGYKSGYQKGYCEGKTTGIKVGFQNGLEARENKKPSPVDFLKEFEAALDEGKMSDRQRGYEEGYDDGFEEGFAAKEKELKGKCSYILSQKPEVFAKEFAELVEAEKENTEQAYTLTRLFATYISMKINQENGLPF